MSNLRRSMMAAGRGGEEPSKWITYEVYVPASAVGNSRVIYNANANTIARMLMNGVEITPVQNYVFSEAGTYNMEVLLVDPTTIPNNAMNAGHFYNVVLPSCVTYIDTNAFRNYSSNNSSSTLTCLATTPPSLNGDPFANRHVITVYVPSASLSAYQTAWSMMQNITAIP